MKLVDDIIEYFRRRRNRSGPPLYFLPDQGEVIDRPEPPKKKDAKMSMLSSITSLFRPKKKKKRSRQRYIPQIEELNQADVIEHLEEIEIIPEKDVLSDDKAALIIQCLVRRRVAVKARDAKWGLALGEAQSFWNEEKRLREEAKIALQTRGQVWAK